MDLLGQQSDASSDETLDVRHMLAREIPCGDSPTTLPPSPGIRILIPANGFLLCRMAGKPIRIPQGMLIVSSGKCRTRLMPAKQSEEEEEAPATLLRIIEINAILNRTTLLEDRLQLPVLANYAPSTKITELFTSIQHPDEATLLTAGASDIYQNLLALTLVSRIIKIAGNSPPKSIGTKETDRLAILKAFLITNLPSRTLTTEIMATHLRMSRPAFCQWAKANLGQSPKQYLKQLRLERSLEFLTQGRISIESIAERTGFSDRYHFDREFKRHFNMTPAAYRRIAGTTASETDDLAPALEAFRKADFAAALRFCERGIEHVHAANIHNQLLYIKGCCLQAIGHPQQALAILQRLRNSEYAHQAGMVSCRLLYAMGNYDQASAYLQAGYKHANSQQRGEVVNLWMEQVQALHQKRKPQPLRAYLDIRKELFVQEDSSMALTAKVLTAMGQYEEVLEQCATMPDRCFQALQRTGKLKEAIRRYGKHVNAQARKTAFYQSGHWQRVLAMPPEIPEMDVKALIGLGRYEEAIRRYPPLAGGAYMALGRYEEILEATPQKDLHHLFARHALGRIDDMQSWAKQHPGFMMEAQMYLNPAAILSTSGPEAEVYRALATMLLTLEALNAGETKQALDLLENGEGIDSPNLWATLSNQAQLLLKTVLRGFLINPARMQEDFDLILSRFRFFHRQSLWHDAAYITHKITRSRFMQQPFQVDIHNRIILMEAITHDFASRPHKAHAAYETFLQNTRPYSSPNLLLHRFAQWRLKSRPHPA